MEHQRIRHDIVDLLLPDQGKGRRHFGEKGIAFEWRMDSGQVNPVREFNGFAENPLTAADEGFVRPGSGGKSGFEIMYDEAARCAKRRIARHDTIRPARQRPADALVGFPAENDGMAPGDRLKPSSVTRQIPGHFVVPPDDAVLRPGGYTGKEHGA